jgi:hypothetical protein
MLFCDYILRLNNRVNYCKETTYKSASLLLASKLKTLNLPAETRLAVIAKAHQLKQRFEY